MMICRRGCSHGCGVRSARGTERRLDAGVTNRCWSRRGWWAGEASGSMDASSCGRLAKRARYIVPLHVGMKSGHTGVAQRHLNG